MRAGLYRDDPAEPVRWSQAMLERAQQAKWPKRIAESLIGCAEGALLSGKVDEAIAVAELAAAELRGINQPINLLDALTVLCAAHVENGDREAARAATREGLQLPWQLESAIVFFDQTARLAALDGLCEQAARLFGFADRGYELTQDSRHSIGAGAQRQGASLIESAIGAAEHARLRKAGAGLTEDQVRALAQDVLER